jgi:hypothetical protein
VPAIALPLPRNLPARIAVLTAGLAAQAGAVALIGPWALPLWLVPDIALLAAISREANAAGRVAPRAVSLYNAVHALPGSVALAALGALASPDVLALGLVWLSHVLVDRAAGYGLRARDGSLRG